MLADPAYDSRENFLEGKEIEPGIKIKRGASGKARGGWTRRRVARDFLKDEVETESWLRRRWGTEGAFPSLKRVFGELVVSRKFKNMVQ